LNGEGVRGGRRQVKVAVASWAPAATPLPVVRWTGEVCLVGPGGGAGFCWICGGDELLLVVMCVLLLVVGWLSPRMWATVAAGVQQRDVRLHAEAQLTRVGAHRRAHAWSGERERLTNRARSNFFRFTAEFRTAMNLSRSKR
jgi:hypothetical protein